MSDSLASLKTKMATAPKGEGVTLRNLIESRVDDIRRALPAATGMTPERLAMVAYTLVRTNPALAGCTPQSLLGALMTTAQLGLEPGPLQHVYYIPRWNKKVGANEVNFQIGYKGMIELARRAGVQIKTRNVYENDEFVIEFGFDDKVVHKPALRDRGDVIGYYLTATWDGGAYIGWMNLDDINARRARSQSADSGPWKTDFDAMSRKSLVRAAFDSNQIPQTRAVAQAINADETVRTSIDAEALDITREPDASTDLETASVDQHALGSGSAAGGDGEVDGLDPGEGGEGRREPGLAPSEDAVGGGSDLVDDGSPLAVPDALPDDVDAAVSWLRTLSRRDLIALAKQHKSIVPKNDEDADALAELAARVIAPTA